MRRSSILLACLAAAWLAAPAGSQAVNWDGGGGGGAQGWGTPANWAPDGSPAGQDVVFDNTAGATAAGTLTNIVDADFNVASLTYENNAADGTTYFHTTEVNSGVTLTAAGSFVVGGLGTVTKPPPADQGWTDSHVTIRGQTPGVGTLRIDDPAGSVLIDPGPQTWYTPAHNVTLDMRELGTFEATTGKVRVGVAGASNARLYLAQSNTITADSLGTGMWNQEGQVFLGRTNALNIDRILPGADDPITGQYNGTRGNLIAFDPSWVNPSVTIRDKAGTGRAEMTIALGGETNGYNTADVDLTGGTVDALLGDVVVGLGGRAREGRGTLSFDAGTVDATSILLGHSVSGNSNAVGTTQGTLNVGGSGNLVAGTITVADEDDTAANRDAEGRLNLTGGSIRAATIQRGDDDGDANGVSELNWSAGTVGNKLGGGLSITGVDVTLMTAATHTFDAEAGQTITVGSVIGEAAAGNGGITKEGLGTLDLGAANTYGGGTLVSEGILLATNTSGSATGTGQVTVASGATLGGTGSIGGLVVLEDGGHLAAGTSPGLLALDSGLTLEDGSLLDFEIGTLSDLIDINGGTLTGAGTGGVTVNVSDAGGATLGGIYTLVDWTDAAGATGVELGDFVLGPTSLRGNLVLTSTTLQFQFVPEPSAVGLAILGLVGLGLFGRRRKT